MARKTGCVRCSLLVALPAVGAAVVVAGCGSNREPIAVLTCETTCADLGEAVRFSSEGSYDPDGGELVYRFDFGDGQTAEGPWSEHAYEEPGARRVVLTVTDAEGASDSSSCIVSIGRLPQGPGLVDDLAFQPTHFDPRIREKGSPPWHGGSIQGFFVAPFDAVPDTVLLNGRPFRSGEGGAEWCEVVQTELRSGDIGILRCHSPSPDVDPGSRVTVEVRAGARSVWKKTEEIPKPSLTPSYITSTVAGTGMLVHVRNDTDVPLEITGLSLDGVDISAFAVIDNPRPGPFETAIIHVPRCDGVQYGVWHVVTVHGSDAGRPISASRAIRLFPPVFPVGDWNSASDDVFNNMENLERYLDAGIDMFIYDPADPTTPPERVLALAEEKGFYVFTHKGSLDGGLESFKAFVETWGDHPRVLTNAVSGEGDLSGTAGETLPIVRMHRELWGDRKPLWIYNACSYHFPSWGPLADMGGMDHYCVMAPKCNTGNTPPFYWDHIEFAGYYAEEIKRACEPGPVWNWTQSLSNTWEIRCTSPEEMRAQWYQVLSRGTRGILWFQYKMSWHDRCPGQAVGEMKRLAQELGALKKILLEGEPASQGVVARVSDPKIDAAVTVSPDGLAIFLTNLHYGIRLILPFVWFPQFNVQVDVTPPAGFEPMRFVLLDGPGRTELVSERLGQGSWRVFVPELAVASAILVEPEP